MPTSSTETVPAPAAAPLPAPVRDGGLVTWRAVEYAVVPGYRPLLLDLVRPASTAEVPLVVFVHGGGWQVGSRSGMGPMFADWSPSPFAELAASGFAVASLDYRRLSGEARFPAPLDDVRAGLTWLAAHRGELGLAGRTALWGESAGGHLAALAALTGSAPTGPGVTARGEVAAVVDWYGPADLTTIAADAAASGRSITDPGAPGSRESLLLGGPAAERPDVARAASPVAQVRPGAPPFLLVHGAADRFVPTRQSERLAAALRDAGAPVRLELVEGADHLWLGDPGLARAAFDGAVAFLAEHLLP
ncbi:alpha/beta hydrolase [Actinomycetospora sp. TBRC 11914]|uniref:alpha/beta hydrolase n=1 Tax=Actinomycetospora sp. TBRC 11914 TaxID=2729387 RepID=UPI00145FCF31|nr:alpha/beta hydrolase [Actinomycetospora sp. TBRC 11914]NMO88509.1 alpha/beta hydrolase [Actinomycetospora sp. TBRC 11914]